MLSAAVTEKVEPVVMLAGIATPAATVGAA
jgi:hypothetical protein